MEISLGPRNTVPIFFPLIAAGVLAACSYYFYFLKHNSQFGFFLLVAAALLPALFWTLGVSARPTFVINDEGIYDERLGVGTIYWADIQSAQIEVKYGNRYICLRVKNADRYISRLAGRRKEKVIENRELGFTLFNVDVQGFNISLVELLHYIESKAGHRAR